MPRKTGTTKKTAAPKKTEPMVSVRLMTRIVVGHEGNESKFREPGEVVSLPAAFFEAQPQIGMLASASIPEPEPEPEKRPGVEPKIGATRPQTAGDQDIARRIAG